jgi:hypothetical protein
MPFGLTIGTERAAALQVRFNLFQLLASQLMFFSSNPSKMSSQDEGIVQMLASYCSAASPISFLNYSLLQTQSWLNI